MTNIDSRATGVRQGFRASIVNASAQYFTRLMATYSSGMLDNGWAFAASASLRYGPNLLVDGVYYNAWAYYFSAEKQFNPNSRLSFTFLGVPTKRGAQMGATDEVYQMTEDACGGYYYNPNWGYQVESGNEGRGGFFDYLDQRNARVRNYHEPLAILNYTHDFSDKTKMSAAASFRFGKNGYSALDWYNGADPKPDYYRNFPSYFTIKQDESQHDTGKFGDAGRYWNYNTGMRQINWADLYNFNYRMGANEDPALDPDGNNYPAGRSYYIVSERHTDQRDFNINTNFEHEINKYSTINGGVSYRFNRTEYYATVKDLLGGEYWVNIDNFADRDDAGASGGDPETMLNDVDGELLVGQGDKYSYDYYGFNHDAKLWASYTHKQGQWEARAGAEVGYSSMHREGLYRKGLFSTGNRSYGKSEKLNFLTYKAKASGTYRFSGLHDLTLSGVVSSDAPYFQNSFVSARTRNDVVENLKTEKTFGGDLTYSMKMPWLTLRASVFYTYMTDRSRLISYYDDVSRAFTNFAMSGINQRHMGVELGFEVPIVGGLSLQGALSYGDYVYKSNPIYTQTKDNDADLLADRETVYYKGLKVENTPQLAANLSLKYRTDSYWFFELDCSFFDQYYLSMNPYRRSEFVINNIEQQYFGIEASSAADRVEDKIDMLMAQEKFDPAVVMNLSIGKSWAFNYKYYLGFSLQVKNLLSFIPDVSKNGRQHKVRTQHIRTGGFEQMRLYREQVDKYDNSLAPGLGDYPIYDYTPFDSKYFYLYGLNWYLNIYFRF